jgi:AAA lid domain
MRDEMDPPVYCSDRRLVKAAGMLRIVAATHGKATVSLQDCLLLQHVLWYHPDDQKALRDWLLKRVVPETGRCFHLSFLPIWRLVQNLVLKSCGINNKTVTQSCLNNSTRCERPSSYSTLLSTMLSKHHSYHAISVVILLYTESYLFSTKQSVLPTTMTLTSLHTALIRSYPGLFGLEYFVENVQKRVTSAYLNKFQETGKMFNSETNLNNFLTNNENMRDIMATIEIEREKDIERDKEKEKEKDLGKEREGYVERFLSPDPMINSLYKELSSIMKVLVKKIVDYQALAKDCRGSGRGGNGEYFS